MNHTTIRPELMRADAELLLLPTADPPTSDQLDELTLRFRGYLMQLIPAVTDRIPKHPRNDDTLAHAMAAVARARRRLAEEPPNGHPTKAIAYAQSLARAVIALADSLAALEAAR
ncbi:DUF6415 family natural product biosynthesis protein [Streptomyces sp. HNM0663]|uniref:DUF6415 family natural product biosynthesis protein n=1 Tax=Streptomyces chengmaiensis TaxID=3040919 RepID=A0ABT6HL74_9ACTN|nr:DUF6415 family natural product biosynthesis protein [Streptomyces chengmaiensis]MDH2389042.1 DUF6415 family natural product biosynthesis protein [Streptomyces chengmaiensis]